MFGRDIEVEILFQLHLQRLVIRGICMNVEWQRRLLSMIMDEPHERRVFYLILCTKEGSYRYRKVTLQRNNGSEVLHWRLC